MKKPVRSIDDKLEALNDLDTGDSELMHQALEKALDDKHYRVVAKAATLCADHLVYDLLKQIRQAYSRFLTNPAKSDPNCIAKRAISRALVDLDCNDLGFYQSGLNYIQLEPVWGGSEDTAAIIRSNCAAGLVASGYHRALQDITLLLADAEPAARLGAVRAIGCGNPVQAELLLRTKALNGDESAEVTGECFSQLLSIEPDESPQFIALFLEPGFVTIEADAVRELAALALGESRLPIALEFLQKAWNEEISNQGFRQVIIRAAALHRSDDAFDWFISIIEHEEINLARAAVDALQMYQHNKKLMKRVESAIKGRPDGVRF